MTNKYYFRIKLTAEVEAFDESDAFDALQEVIGIGPDGGVVITECEYAEIKKRK